MTNHVHLLITGDESSAISRTMQTLGRRYVGYVNASYRRTGTLWEGRFKACLVDSDTYVLTCYRYIELNPVRAAMVEEPAAYRWSSYQTNALDAGGALVTPHPAYLALGRTNEERQASYRHLFLDALSDDRLQEIRAYLHQQRALGSSRFQQDVEAQLQQAATVRPRGRPSRRSIIG
jgi:putative transposase